MSSENRAPLRELLDGIDELIDFATRCRHEKNKLEEENEELREKIEKLQSRIGKLEDRLQDQRMEFADVMGRLEHRLETIREHSQKIQ